MIRGTYYWILACFLALKGSCFEIESFGFKALNEISELFWRETYMSGIITCHDL